MADSTSKKRVNIETSLVTKVFLGTFIAFFVSMLVNTLGTMIDGFIVGQSMETEDLSAGSVSAPLWFLIALVINLLTKGCQNSCAEKLSRGKEEEARDVYSMTFMVALVFALIFMVLLIIFNYPITKALGLTPDMKSFNSCRMYILGSSIGIPAVTVINMISSSLHLEGARKWTMYAVLIMTVFDVVLDIISVYVLHGGMFLMGLSTSISNYLAMVFLVYFFIKKDFLLKPRFVRIIPLEILKLSRVGMPLAVSRLTTSWKSSYINHIMAVSLMTTSLAAYNVQVQVNYITNALFMGLAQTLGLLVCIFYAEENKKALRKTVFMTLFFEIFIGIVFSVVLSGKPVVMGIISLYLGSNYEVYKGAYPAVSLFFSGLLYQGIVLLFANYLQSIKRILWANLIYILDDVIFTYLVVDFFLDAAQNAKLSSYDITAIVFLGLEIAHFFVLFSIPIIMLLMNRRIEFSWNAFLLLPKDFGALESDQIFTAPKTIDEVTDFSARIYSFCLQKNINIKKAYYVSFAAEEMLKNIIEYGFEEGKNNRVEVLLICKNQEVILRIRDNCKLFNPTTYYKKYYKDSDAMTNIGIRMVMNLASEVSYTSALKLNNLTIKV